MNWKSIIVSALVTGVVTIAAAMAVFWLQERKPELTYTNVVSIPFLDEDETLYICQIDVGNTGDVAIEDIVLNVEFENSNIEDHRTLIDNAIKYSESLNTTSLAISIPELNSEEQFRIQLVVKGDQSEEPQISLRGKGVVGESSSLQRDEGKSFALYTAVGAAYLGLVGAIISSRAGRRVVRLIIGGRSATETQREVFGSAFAIHGRPQIARHYADTDIDRTYWLESDIVAAEAIATTDAELLQTTLTVLRSIAAREHMHKGSKAIIRYNIARLLRSLGDNAFEQELVEAAEFDRPEIEKRIQIDPIFQGFRLPESK